MHPQAKRMQKKHWTASAPANPQKFYFPKSTKPIKLVTIGAFDVDSTTSADLRSDVVERYNALGMCRRHGTIELILNSIVFEDPKPQQFRDCIGEHKTNIEGVVFCSSFNMWLRRSLTKIEELMQNNPDGKDDFVMIAVMCMHGRHRSVACAAVLRAILIHAGFNLHGINEHLARRTWRRSMRFGVCDR